MDDHAAALTANLSFVAVVFVFRKQWLRFALGLTILILAYTSALPRDVERGQRRYATRNFFGVKKVIFDQDRNRYKLLHGDTLHGMESRDPVRSGQPIAYYHPTGPAGDVMRAIESRPDQHVGVVGLGAGSMAFYASPKRRMTFFEIDPQVASIAHGFFTHTRRCGQKCDVVLGDGRLAIEQAGDGEFDVLLLDAFSSDSIPAHLMSREALQLYLRKLKPDGIVLFHVSNRYLRVEQLAAALLEDAGMKAIVRNDDDESAYGKTGSDYVAGAREFRHFGALAHDANWVPADSAGVPVWTDDYSNLWSLVRWR
jgi:SAM-dependent methyltransferase